MMKKGDEMKPRFQTSSAVSFVLFGGTGDLTRCKLVPGFADLIHRGVIGKGSKVIGVSRKPLSDAEYKKFLVDSVSDEDYKKHVRTLDVSYLSMDVTKSTDFKKLEKAMAFCGIQGCNRVYYLATSFKFFPDIVNGLKKYDLHKVHKGFTRIAFEKPFGKDLKSSNELDNGMKKVFSEEQIHRVDHYLAKETVQNILVLKKSKYGKLFNGKDVAKVEVIVDESLGVGNRLGYYNDAGALRDMIQNHLLQVLSLVMIAGDKVHEDKVKMLKSLKVLSGNFGQYRGFEEERNKAILPDKKTETFARLELKSESKRWEDTLFILRTGKKLAKKEGKVVVSLRSGEKITIYIYPKQEIEFSDGKRSKGICKECGFSPNSLDEYSVVLEEIVKGDKKMFTSGNEVRESWKIVEKAEELKKKNKLEIYEDGSSP
jgi:glucose-6-phosphate 1-dehydrogenase